MRRALASCGALLAAVLVAGPFPASTLSAQRSAPAGLDRLFDPARGVVRDTNGDGLADSVAARVVVPATPTIGDVEAATNIAARLGFETTALSLPIVVRDRDVADPAAILVPILVGRDNVFVQRLAAAGTIDLAALEKGQGLVAVVTAPLGGPDGVVVVGADDDGTRAAGVELGARLPRLWGMSGIRLGGIGDDVQSFLRSRGAPVSAPVITSLVVDRDRRGILRTTVSAEAGAGAVPKAVAALEALDRAHRAGQEPRVIDYANIAETAVELWADGRMAGRVVVPRMGLNQRTLTPPIDPEELADDSPGARGAAAEVRSAPAKPFDLADAYSIDGWFGDVYRDLVPDRTETTIVLGDASDTIGAAHIATRLGLETTGVSLPITKLDAKVRTAAREASPILVGRGNSLVADLVKIGKARLDDLGAGEGAIQIVPRAFGNATATVVAGADPAGTEAASLYLARRVPYLWEVERGAFTLDDLKNQARRFFQAKSAAGQAGQAVRALDGILEDAKDEAVQSVEAKLFLEHANPELDAYLAKRISAAWPDAKVTVASQGITDPVTVFEDKIDIPWEVDEFWEKLRGEVLPAVKAGSEVRLEARLSESPEYRREIAEQARAELAQAGASDPQVTVLSAYKQGFLWLTEQVIPALEGKNVRSVRVKVREYHPDLSKDFKFYMVPTRWLHELYPVDEIFARELGLAKDRFTLELVPDAEDIYTLEAVDRGGHVVYSATFSPKVVEREYLDKFPGWSRVEVTTGWLTAAVDGQTVVDARIATDPERFWDHYQGKVLPRIYDNVMKVTDNKPMPDKQPFHRDLDIEVWMSEPDFRIGVDEEQVSSLESLHEDLYFVTLDFYDALGRTTTKRRLAAPGKIFPIIHPERRGQAGQARILYAGNASTKASLQLSYTVKDEEKPTKVTRDLAAADVTAPTVTRVVARADGLREIELRMEATDDAAAARAADALDGLARLHEAGLYREDLSYAHVDGLAFSILLKDARTRRVIAATGEAPPSNVRRASAPPPAPLVTWDHIISPEESEAIIGKLAAYPEIKSYRAGHSYRGRDISVMEITLPTPSELVSTTKLTAYKPTIFITGRQHANEVSSTSHILRLAELIATDPDYNAILKKVNVILHPVENPDGAAMAYELQKLTPTHMLHAGRYSALGMDVASQVGRPDPLLPESLVRGRVWEDWRPDIYLNPHGYPSHEWVQQFAGYVPNGFRTYLSSRGWYTSVGGLRDPRYPEHAQAVAALRDAIAREINTNADVRAMNLRSYARYQKWAQGFAPYLYNLEVYKDTAIYYTDPETGEPRGSSLAATGGGRQSMRSWPQVTFVSGGTEAPDETAQGDWLTLVIKPGFSYLMAHVKYLRDGRYTVQRIEDDASQDGVTLTMVRVRPVLPTRRP